MHRWSFLTTAKAFSKLQISDSLPRARLSDLGTMLSGHGYQVFARGGTLYAFKGLPGRLAPIGVHAALLLIMAGRTCFFNFYITEFLRWGMKMKTAFSHVKLRIGEFLMANSDL